jgi:molybdate transport system substrate-binding protein
MTAKLAASLRLMWPALLLPLLAACGGAEAPERGPTVLAASSLQGALEEAAGAWTARGHPAPVLSFAATSALARQAEQGAPADLFVSADRDWMDTLEQEGLLRAGTRRDLLRTRLVLVTRRGGAVRSIGELGDGRLALADPGAVPAGKYARAALESLGEWDAVAGRQPHQGPGRRPPRHHRPAAPHRRARCHQPPTCVVEGTCGTRQQTSREA